MSSLWSQIRKDFLITDKYLYFDHAAGGPVPRPVREAVEQYYREQAEEADFAWMKWVQRREEVRQKAARFIGADPSEITFTSSTSQGMNYVAELLASQGTVLTNTSEFPSSTVPWVWRKAKMIWQEPEKNGVLPLSHLKTILTPEIKTILTSFVQYATGFRQDLAKLSAIKENRFLVVNATQGFGAFPIDVQEMKIDFLVTNSYKWLLAGYGGGILYLRKAWLEKFAPQTVGWRSAADPEKMDNRHLELNPDAMRYELGCPNFPGIFAVGAAIDYLTAIGMDKISKRILELTDFLIQGLDQMGVEVASSREPAHRSGIVIFKSQDPKTLWKKLMAEGICVSARGEGIRVAPHFYNTEEELGRFLKALKRFI
ncbi:MAG: aminotransferase class V-fold PLP-dependent enzyme [Candidatus Omnitrophica bacterium]|nr:aminotransferase class V-fold PLP-dependent enzyme [Candidatus Omnitrophota bacterium]